MRPSPFVVATVLLAAAAARPAEGQTVTVAVDAASGRHPIDPRIYGVSWASQADLAALNGTLNRWGGNAATRYNWRENADNRAADWYFESIGYSSATAGAEADAFVAATRGAGASPMLTVPIIGWVARLGSGRSKLASFSISKYGPQTDSDRQWFPDAGNGISSITGQTIVGNDPTDASVAVDSAFQQGWVGHLVSKWGPASSGGVLYYLLDNEHGIWWETHRDVAPEGATMDEIRDRMIDYASRIKAADPGALVLGPEEWGWTGYFWSGYDLWYYRTNGCCRLPDREAHGGADYVPWLLQQMRQRQQATGQRLLDVLSVHYYPQGGEFGNDTSSAMQLRRNRSTRSLWDPNYVDESWIADRVQLVPRLRSWVGAYYPGTQIALTEYSWGAEGHINGATAQADVLGILGREGMNLANRWVSPAAGSPTFKAMQLYRNYDGNRSTFGDTSVQAVAPNPDQLAAFAAERSVDGALTVMLVNKVAAASATVVELARYSAGTAAQVWQLRSTNVIQRLADAAVSGGRVSLTLPAQSITLLVIPPGGGSSLSSVSVSDASVTEGDSGMQLASFAVSLSSAATSTVSVAYATANGKARAGTDYVAASGMLDFAPGETGRTVSVAVVGDTLREANETFTLRLSQPQGATLGDATGVATILDDDSRRTRN